MERSESIQGSANKEMKRQEQEHHAGAGKDRGRSTMQEQEDGESVMSEELILARTRSGNLSLVNYLVLPVIFLTVALLGGLRVSDGSRAFIFMPPPLITLVLSVLLVLLFVRGGLIELRSLISVENPALTNIAHVWLLITLFFACAQAFNSVLPEHGLLHWLFSFFFLWTLWNNQFSSFDARRLLRSLAVLFGTAFVLKYMLLASLYSQDGGWLKRVASALVSGVTLGTLDAPVFAPATGYISFFTIGLYIAGLVLMSFVHPRVDERMVVSDTL